MPADGYVIDAGGDWGYGDETYRRKVLVWSKYPWRQVGGVQEGAAKGRVLAAVTDTNDGPIRVIAVCIPWRDAHVNTGRKTATGWDEHVECCGQLLALRRGLNTETPTVVAGDYNQQIPRKRQTIRAEQALEAALVDMSVWTGGDTRCGQLIDHIAGSPEIAVDRIDVWAKADAAGPLSDHTGVACDTHFV